MGITPDISIHGKKRTLKAAALVVIAAQRIKRLSESWAANRRVHAQLMKTWEGMKRRGGKSTTVAGQQLRIAR